MKTAIVTGASRGIGRAIAERLMRDGFRVIATGRDEVLLASLNTPSIALDLRDPTSAQALIEFALLKTGRIDVVVNNAGATKRGLFLELSEGDWLDGYSLKLFGAVRVARAAWPHLKAARGSIVNIAGVGGRTPGAEFSIGGSVNAALLSFTKSLAEQGVVDGVQVNAINPGAIRTDRLRKRLAAIDEDAFVKSQLITRVGEPEEVAALVAFLVSSEGRYMHGSLIDIDGGATKTM
ncbi:MAG: SDR family oxidoreductase [Acidobacteria bacterium]|nr:SDR family oxidoreductase [Acidobacteriota bacterium]